MPELPDVAVNKQYLDATALHQQIEEVEVRDTLVLSDITSEALRNGLRSHTLESSRRHGKYLFAEISEDGWLLLHFGMSGDLDYFKGRDAPEYTQVLLSFTNGYHLAYTSRRKLGMVGIVEAVEEFVEEQDLGPDALSPDFDLAAFRDALSGRRGMVKSTLMNQEIMAGIGNVYSDEILFQAGVHPRTAVNDLREETVKDLYRAMQDVLQTAIDCKAKPDEMPATYLIRHRQEDADCPRCGGRVKRVDVSGRSGYYCPCHQDQAP